MNNKVAEIITNRFLEGIKSSGSLPWTKPWKTVAFRNAVSGRQYNGINVLMLALFGRDTDYLTFNQAKDNKGMVRKGSKGLPIVYYQALDKKDKVTGDVIRNSRGQAEQWRMLRYSTVFNLSDIEGCDALKAKAAARNKLITFSPIETCEALVKNYGITIKYDSNQASYSPAIHAIQMPDKERFVSVEKFYCTLFHEIGHSLAKEQGEDIANGFGSDPYAREELVAELFANFCLSYAGIDSSTLFDHSLAYVQSWTSKLTSDPTILISAASRASKRLYWLLGNAGLLVQEETPEVELEASVA